MKTPVRPKPTAAKLSLIGGIVFLVAAGAIMSVLIFQKLTTPQLSSLFPPVAGNISSEELLKTALTRLLSVKGLSYSVAAKDRYSADVTLQLKPEGQELASKTTYTGPNGDSSSFKAQVKSGNVYFRNTSIPSSVKDDNPQRVYLNKWILVNQETSKGIGAGSEYLGFYISSSSAMDAPFIVGNMSEQIKQLVTAKIDAGLYSITSAEKTKYHGFDVIKLTLATDYKAVGALYKDIYDKHDSSAVYMQPSYTMSSLGYGMGPNYNATTSKATIYVSPINAQVFEISNFMDSDNLPAFSSKDITYRNLRFDALKLPPTPTETIPFNEYYR